MIQGKYYAELSGFRVKKKRKKKCFFFNFPDHTPGDENNGPVRYIAFDEDTGGRFRNPQVQGDMNKRRRR